MKNLPESSDPKKLGLSSKLGKIRMAILTVQICVHRQRRPLNYLKTTFQALPWLHSGLKMPLDTKNKQMMHCQHATCPSSQRSGTGNTAGAECGMAHFQMALPRTFISQTLMSICQDGSKA